MSRFNYMKEAGLVISEIANARIMRENSKIETFLKEMKDKEEEILSMRENASFKRGVAIEYKTRVLTEMLSAAFKGIFITAMEQCNDMTRENYIVCESLVDKYIEEVGSPRVILNKMEKKTYLLDTVKKIVEDVADEIEDSVDEDDKEVQKIPDEPKEKMFDKLENEEDVDTAVELIATRISNAEEEFIKKNAEDKEKIEQIVTSINDRINAVKMDNTMDDEIKESIEQEQYILSKRKINEVYDRRSHNVFETMVHEVSTVALKNDEMKKLYTLEDGSLNIEKIVGSVKCLYGFLEFVNTIQLEKVDEEYIKRVLTEI